MGLEKILRKLKLKGPCKHNKTYNMAKIGYAMFCVGCDKYIPKEQAKELFEPIPDKYHLTEIGSKPYQVYERLK